MRPALIALLLVAGAGIAAAADPPVGYSKGPAPINVGNPVSNQPPPVEPQVAWCHGYGGAQSNFATCVANGGIVSIGDRDAVCSARAATLDTSWSACVFQNQERWSGSGRWGGPYGQPSACQAEKLWQGCSGGSGSGSSWQNLTGGLYQGTACPEGSTLQGDGLCHYPPEPEGCPAGSQALGSSCWKCGSGLKVVSLGGVESCITDYESQCPYAMGTGFVKWDFRPGQATDAPICVSTTNPYQSAGGLVERVCQAIPTGTVIVCASDGCATEQSRLTGVVCGSANAEHGEVATDCSGRLWCKATSSSCVSGYVLGEFDGEQLCVQAGKVVAHSPQSQQPGKTIQPPYEKERKGEDPNPIESGGIGGTTQGPREGGGPSGRTVVSVGGATGTGAPGGGGSGGSGSGGMGDLVVCGVPGSPPCKIDESGTPSKGDYSEAGKKLDDAAKAREGLAGQVVADKESTSWGFSFNPPTSCTNPPSAALPGGVTLEADLCQWEPQIHAVMSFVWVLLTLGSVLSMVRGSLAGGNG